MPLTDEGLLHMEKRHRLLGGGVQRIYRWGQYGLSLINSPGAHPYPFAWEAATIRFRNVGIGIDASQDKFVLVYDTPLTADVEVFFTVADTNAFIQKAKELFTSETYASRDSA